MFICEKCSNLNSLDLKIVQREIRSDVEIFIYKMFKFKNYPDLELVHI